jgi:hypothetical protein
MPSRAFLALAFGVLTAMAFAAPAAAAPPSRDFLPAPDFVEFDAGVLCDFPVRLTVVENKEYGVTWFDGDTPIRTIVSGRLVLNLMNLDDPSKNVTVNASGPGLVEYLDNGDIRVTLRGRSFIFLPATDTDPALFFLNSGQVVELGNGTIQPVVLPVQSQIGHRVDYCPIIA